MNAHPASSTLVADLAWAGGAPVRIPVRWDQVQAHPGSPDWSSLDAVIEPLAGSGHQILVALAGTPEWARDLSKAPEGLWLCDDPAATSGAAVSAPPRDPADLAAFAAQVASRYGDDLFGIEVWPEPNLLPNWSATGPDPEAYGRMLAQVSERVHAASPPTRVVSGGLAPTTDVGVCYMSDLVFLDRLARSGALAHVDAVGIEPFGLRSEPVEHPDRERLNFRRAELSHEILVRNGLAELPLWAVAWGWNAGRSPESSPWGSYPPDVAAAWTADAYGIATRWPWLAAAFSWHVGPQVPRSASSSESPGVSAADGFALIDASARLTQPGQTVRSLMAGRRPSAPVLPARPLSAAVQAALALCLAGTIAAMLVLARRTKLSLVAATVAERCRLPLAQAAVAAGILAVMWVALGEVRAEDGWLGLIVAAILVLVLAGRPELAPAACVLAAPFHSKVAVPLGPVNIGILEAAIACAFGGWAIAWTGVGRRSRLGLVDWLAVALVVWGGIAVVWSDFQWEALREWRVVLLEPALVFLMLRGSTSRARSAEIALDALVAGATLAALWGLASLGGAILGSEGAGVVRAEGVLRIAGPYGSPNNLALFAGRAVSVAAATALFAISSRRRRIHAAQLIVLLLAIGATFSRGALFIGLPVALAALVTIAVATRGTTFRALRRAAAVAAVGVLAFLAAFARTDRIAGAFSPAPGGTLHLRLRLWESALRMGLDHPILGVGPDNFLGHYRDTYVQRDAVQERFLNHPHNLVLDTWLRLGIAGAIAVGVVAVRTVIAGVRGLGQEGRPRALGAAALVGLAYTVAHGLIDNFLFVPDLAVAWWILVASALAAEEARVVTPTDGG